MATIHCKCGKIFSDGAIPCEHEYHLLADVAVEDLVDKVTAVVAKAEDAQTEVGYAIVSASNPVYKCPFCDRLIIFWEGLSKEPRFYKAD